MPHLCAKIRGERRPIKDVEAQGGGAGRRLPPLTSPLPDEARPLPYLASSQGGHWGADGAQYHCPKQVLHSMYPALHWGGGAAGRGFASASETPNPKVTAQETPSSARRRWVNERLMTFSGSEFPTAPANAAALTNSSGIVLCESIRTNNSREKQGAPAGAPCFQQSSDCFPYLDSTTSQGGHG